MTMLAIGDMHLEKKFPFTNKTTLARWRALQEDTLSIIRVIDTHDKVQAGDLFDDFMVRADDFLRAYNMANVMELDYVLAGNHDTSNNTELQSALHLLGGLADNTGCLVVHTDVQSYLMSSVMGNDKGWITFVPHQLSQKQFEEALGMAITHVKPGVLNILVLHCNYGDREGTNTENYLRPEIAADLRKHFDIIVSGHEHNGSQPRDGLWMLGSILPMNFGEMTDKFVYEIDDEGNVTRIPVWQAEGNYACLNFKEFLELLVNTPLQFIQVNGEVNVAESVAVAKKIADWYSKSETLIAIKNNTMVMKQDGKVDSVAAALDWVKEVSKQLTDEEFTLFNDMLNGVDE